MKLSEYNILKKSKKGKIIVFNSFSSSLMILNDIHELNITDNNKSIMIDNGIYIDDDFNEMDYLKQIKDQDIQDESYQHYTIFTTTHCNARCYYCFQNNLHKGSMNVKTANEVFEYIKSSLKDDVKRLHIQWFGGEPLINFEVIKIINDKLIKFIKNTNIKLTENIVTNGSLINLSMLNYFKKMNIVNIQITLDGTKEIYEGRKNYFNMINSYDIVLENVRRLLANDYPATIRLNFDNENVNDINNLLEELVIFQKYKNFSCYALPLYLSDKKPTNDQFSTILMMMIKLNYIKTSDYFRLGQVANYCKAFKQNTRVIDCYGNLFKCTHDLNESIGNIKDNEVVEIDAWKRANYDLECLSCLYLPLCQGGCEKKENSNCGYNCYVYKEYFNEVLSAILYLHNIDDKVID